MLNLCVSAHVFCGILSATTFDCLVSDSASGSQCCEALAGCLHVYLDTPFSSESDISVYTPYVYSFWYSTNDHSVTVYCTRVVPNLPVIAQVPDWCEQEWRLAMESCWEVNPDHRPSLRDLARRLELIMEHAAD